MKRYLEQWTLVKKYYKKILDIELNEQGGTSDDCLEYAYLFFQNCFILKDWIKNSEDVSKEVKIKIEEIFNKDECLAVCAGLANTRKHLKPNIRKKYGDSSIITHMVTVSVPIVSRNSPEIIPKITKAKFNWELKSGGKIFNVIHLAKNCMESIKKFMIENCLAN